MIVVFYYKEEKSSSITSFERVKYLITIPKIRGYSLWGRNSINSIINNVKINY